MGSEVDPKLADLLSSKGCNEWHEVQLDTAGQWCASGLNTESDIV